MSVLSWTSLALMGPMLAQIRVMPNTPCLIGQAASAYVLGNHATNEDAAKIYMLLSSAGGAFMRSRNTAFAASSSVLDVMQAAT